MGQDKTDKNRLVVLTLAIVIMSKTPFHIMAGFNLDIDILVDTSSTDTDDPCP